jgi:hypothetical protein
MPTRRTFLLAGLAGTAALAFASWLRRTREAEPEAPFASHGGALGADATEVLAAVIPVFLDGALPPDPAAAQGAIDETMASIAAAVAGLPPAAQHELSQLFSLLAFAPARIALARVDAPWREADRGDVAAFLERWRTSGFLLFRSAHAALHQLVFAAWYGNPASWPAIGYPGPPRLPA